MHNFNGSTVKFSSNIISTSSVLSSCWSGEQWTEEALDEFERLTHCATWSPLQAKLCSYSHSDISSWPSVKLYDNNEGWVSSCLIVFVSASLFGLSLVQPPAHTHTFVKQFLS